MMILSKGQVLDIVLVILAALVMVTQAVREMDGLTAYEGTN